MTREELINAYRQLPSGNVADALNNLGYTDRCMVDGPVPISLVQPRMVGFARTVQQMPRHYRHTEKKLVRHLEVMTSIAQPGDVVVIDVGNRKDVCTGGGMGALCAKQRGVSGLVINGCYRDLKDVLEMGFPLFCTGSSPQKSVPGLETVGIDVPVTIGGVQICSGDLLVGDDTGIVVVPPDKAEDVLAEAQRIQSVETLMQQYILQGIPYSECRKRAEQEAK